MLEDRLGMFERRAFRITGQHRSTQRHRPKRRLDRDAVLRAELRALLREHPRWGYRKAWACLREQGWVANRKKIQRLWREEGLRVPAKRRKRYRLGISTTPAARLRAKRPELLRMDSGPELTANALRDWCHFGGSGTSYIEPGSP